MGGKASKKHQEELSSFETGKFKLVDKYEADFSILVLLKIAWRLFSGLCFQFMARVTSLENLVSLQKSILSEISGEIVGAFVVASTLSDFQMNEHVLLGCLESMPSHLCVW